MPNNRFVFHLVCGPARADEPVGSLALGRQGELAKHLGRVKQTCIRRVVEKESKGIKHPPPFLTLYSKQVGTKYRYKSSDTTHSSYLRQVSNWNEYNHSPWKRAVQNLYSFADVPLVCLRGRECSSKESLT